VNAEKNYNLEVSPTIDDRLAKQKLFELRWPARKPLPGDLRRRICCIIPCYDVGRLCEPVLRDCVPHVARIIAVDDGSSDDTAAYLKAAQERWPRIVHVLTLGQNRGKGVALLRGFRQALHQTDCDVIVTLDGDGQHRAGDIPRVAEPCLKNEADLTIAQRQFPPEAPARSRIGNLASHGILKMVYRKCPPDTQCGLRGHRRELVARMVQTLEGNRYDTEARILMLAMRWRRRVAQAQVPAIYLGKNESSHYRPWMDSFRIFGAFLTVVALPEMGIPVNPNGLFPGRIRRRNRSHEDGMP
jgi:glycosyltransferase involved in cell wall biosynthesis